MMFSRPALFLMACLTLPLPALGQETAPAAGAETPTPLPDMAEIEQAWARGDYVFVRQHRYIFKEMSDVEKTKLKEQWEKKKKQNPLASVGPPVKTRLQELGPRFTLKLRWLQEGTFDTKFGEYEWIHKRKEMDITRRKFHL